MTDPQRVHVGQGTAELINVQLNVRKEVHSHSKNLDVQHGHAFIHFDPSHTNLVQVLWHISKNEI